MRNLRLGISIICIALTLWFGAALLADSRGAASATPNMCGPHRETIVDLSQRILSEKTMAEGLSGRNFGTVATYLMLRQSEFNLGSGMDLLARAEDGKHRAPRRLEEVRLAFAISKLGVEEGLVVDGRRAVEAFADFSPAVARQILLADAGESFFHLLAEVRADPNLAESFETRYYDGLGVHGWVIDQTDDFKLHLARNAEGVRELVVAAMVLASRRDLTEYHALLERHRDTDLTKFAGPKWPDSYLATMLHQTEPIPVPGDTADDKNRRADRFDIMSATYRMGGLGWLGILHNQTGAEVPIARAARDFLAEIEAGRLDPQTDLEAAWAYLYGRLAQELGAGTLNQSMTGFSLPRSVRHYADNAQTTLDWVNARQTLVPYLKGAEGDLPPRPALLTPEFDWKAWTTLAAALRAEPGHAPVSTRTDPKISAELLLAKGDVALALDVARGIMPNTDRLWFYRDVMIRLDRRCDKYTFFPGAELVMGGAILFRFD